MSQLALSKTKSEVHGIRSKCIKQKSRGMSLRDHKTISSRCFTIRKTINKMENQVHSVDADYNRAQYFKYFN